MKKILKFKIIEGGKPPEKKRDSDSCYDLSARKVTIRADLSVEVLLGVALEIPEGYDVRIYPRSSLSETGYILGNSVGVIDQTYTGELRAIFWPVSNKPFPYDLGDRCLQMEMRRKLEYDIEEVDELHVTERGDKGFGSTGK